MDFELYSDSDGTFSKAVGITFQSSERQTSRLLEYSAGLNEGYLPVPSVLLNLPLPFEGRFLVEGVPGVEPARPCGLWCLRPAPLTITRAIPS